MKLLLLFTLLGIASTAFALPFNLGSQVSSSLSGGPGLGMMYGRVGANLEYRVTNQASATAGIGLDGNGGWFAGGRYYFKPASGRGPRGRITAGIGTLDAWGSLAHTGASLAIGWSWANAGNDYEGLGVDVSTQGEISVGYQF